MFTLTRVSEQPILHPNPNHSWEKEAVFNCGVTFDGELFHMLYRAADRDFAVLSLAEPDPDEKFVSVFGYAVSQDGFHFKRLDQPVYAGEGPQEDWGVEDPRISRLQGEYYILYTAFGGRSWADHRICMAKTRDFHHYDRLGIVLDEPNKDAALLENKVGGRYMLFHRREPHIWATFSNDLTSWSDHTIVMETREGKWDNKKIGIAGQPIAFGSDYLMLYHGVDEHHVYRLGAALLDGRDPTKVLARQDEPILEPELPWEKEGLVPNVVFSNGQAIKDGVLYVYYGGADQVIGVATIPLHAIHF